MDDNPDQTQRPFYNTFLQSQNWYDNALSIPATIKHRPKNGNQKFGLMLVVILPFLLASIGGVLSLTLYNSSPVKLSVQGYYEAVKK